MADNGAVLEVRGLSTQFDTESGVVRAVEEVSFSLEAGRTLGLVGESGCGKSVTSLSIMRLIPVPPGRIAAGQVVYRGRDLLSLPEREMRKVRGKEIAMIFQEPMTSLNPVFTIGYQIMESARLHLGLSRRDARALAIEMLAKVGIPAPEQRVDDYPHQLSGGMKQRVMIAMAIICKPSVLIADEPTTALDVTIQAQILDLLRGLQREYGMALVLITHDLGIVAETADEVGVMYAGRIVERAPVRELFARPRHPYTVGLFESLPRIGRGSRRLKTIPGSVPNPLDFPSGCRFHPRCPRVVDRCPREEPALSAVAAGHETACWNPPG